jgi:hypothetical protein
MEKTITKTKIKVEIDNELKDLIKSESQEERQVVLHCTCISTMARIWPTTHLYENSTRRSNLVAIYNITWGPAWKHFAADKPASFTLIFSPLPKSVKVFDLREILPPYAGFGAPFIAYGIRRNKSDIYDVLL